MRSNNRKSIPVVVVGGWDLLKFNSSEFGNVEMVKNNFSRNVSCGWTATEAAARVCFAGKL